jgi:arsenate reductase
VFPGEAKERLAWLFPDPAEAQGTEEEVLSVFREIRDQIKIKLSKFINQLKQKG